MNRRLTGAEPPRVETIFDRANEGLDRIESTPTQLAEVADTFDGTDRVAGVRVQLSAREAVRQLLDGPVMVPRLDRGVFLRLGRLYDTYTMHDALLVATHKSRQTDGILTNDSDIRTFDGDAVVWN